MEENLCKRIEIKQERTEIPDQCEPARCCNRNYGVKIEIEDAVGPKSESLKVTNLSRNGCRNLHNLIDNRKTVITLEQDKNKTKQQVKNPVNILEETSPSERLGGKPESESEGASIGGNIDVSLVDDEEEIKREYYEDRNINREQATKTNGKFVDDGNFQLERVDIKQINESSDSAEELISLSQLAKLRKRKMLRAKNEHDLQKHALQLNKKSIKADENLNKPRKRKKNDLNKPRNFEDRTTDVNKQQFQNSDSEESDGLQEFLSAVEPTKPKYKPRRKPQYTEEQKAERERRKLEKRTCTVCNTVFAFPGGLRNHFRSKHTLEKPYTCDICGEEFAIQSSYSLHKRRHLGIKPHLCNLCGKTFLRRMDMRIHMRRHIPSDEKVRDIRCSFCPNVYTSKLNLRKHVLSKHTDPSEWKHVCNICGKKCFSATELTHHIRQHNDDRKYKCVICGRGFFTKQSMNVHVRTHSASTAYNCELCSNGYRSNEALQRHLLKVHGIGEEKPITAPSHFCPICNDSFRQRARLEQHLLLHETGEEEYPFECEKCNKRYKARNYFTIHMLDKHNVFIDDSYFKTRFQSTSQTSVTVNAINGEYSDSKGFDNISECSDTKDFSKK